GRRAVPRGLSPRRSAGDARQQRPPTRPDPFAEAVHIEVDDGRRIERQRLADDQPTDDGDAERTAHFAAIAETEGEWQSAKDRRHRRHHNGTKTQDASLVYRIVRRSVARASRVDGEIDHENRILFDDAD